VKADFLRNGSFLGATENNALPLQLLLLLLPL
jgi:hypothetical protein